MINFYRHPELNCFKTFHCQGEGDGRIVPLLISMLAI